MDCRKVSRKLSAYIEEDLSPRDRQAFEEHLRVCDWCRRLVVEVKTIMQAAGQLPVETPGPYFTNRLLCALEQKRSPGEILSSWRYRLTLSGVAFAIAASVTLVIIGPPASTIEKAPAGNLPSIQAGVPGDTADAKHGFPVSEEVLKRDMALDGGKSNDTLVSEPVMPRQYVQPVGIKKTEGENEVF
jgi:anti-sigma factor RsiW